MESTERLRVLLIEDEFWVRAVTAQALSRGGTIEVIEAASGAEGVEAAERERPQCVLLDRVLPDCDGAEVLDRLLAIDPDRPPVVVVTTLVDGSMPDDLLERGAAAILPKPLDLVTLAETVERLVADRTSGRRSP